MKKDLIIAQAKLLLKNMIIENDKIWIKEDIEKNIFFIKEYFHFDQLVNIAATKKDEDLVELYYKLYNCEDDEKVIVAITVDNKAESIACVFGNATIFEDIISKVYSVNF